MLLFELEPNLGCLDLGNVLSYYVEKNFLTT